MVKKIKEIPSVPDVPDVSDVPPVPEICEAGPIESLVLKLLRRIGEAITSESADDY